MVPPQPRLTSPPLGVVGGRGAPEALPSLLPPPPPTPGRAATICGYSFTRQKKKKVCRMSHTEKKKIRNRAKKTCEWAWRMGLLKLRWSRGSPSHSASLRERSLARPARPPAPWTSEQVGARRPRPRPPPPLRSLEIRFHPSPGSPEPEPGPAPPAGLGPVEARLGALESGPAGRGIPAVRSAGPGGGRATRSPGEAATWSPSERGPANPDGRAPRKSRGERVRGGAGLREGDAARGAAGAGEEEGGGGRPGSPGPGQREAREADTSGRAALPPRPGGGEGGKEGGREGRRGGERSPAGRAAGRTRGFLAAPRGRSPPCCPRPRSRRQVGAGGGGGAAALAPPPRPGSD